MVIIDKYLAFLPLQKNISTSSGGKKLWEFSPWLSAFFSSRRSFIQAVGQDFGFPRQLCPGFCQDRGQQLPKACRNHQQWHLPALQPTWDSMGDSMGFHGIPWSFWASNLWSCEWVWREFTPKLMVILEVKRTNKSRTWLYRKKQRLKPHHLRNMMINQHQVSGFGFQTNPLWRLRPPIPWVCPTKKCNTPECTKKTRLISIFTELP